jgi:CDP-diglyceride synthetase
VLCLERFYGLNLYLECLVCLVFSVVGDLYISVLKRKNNIKDTGNILPGHGGLLDRIDSHIATVSLVWLFKHAIYI